MHEGDRSRRHGVVGANGRTLGTKLGDRESDAARSLREPHHIARGLGDVLDVVLHFQNKAVRELRIRRARIDKSRTGSQIFKRRHLAIETQCDFGGVRFVERQTHCDTHPEILRNLERVTVASLDAVTVVERHHTDVLEECVVRGLESCREDIKIKHLGQSRVEQALLDSAANVRLEVFGVEFLEFLFRRVVAEHVLVDGLQEQAGGDGVESGVVLDVL